MDDETKPKIDEKRRRRTKTTTICRETGDHVHYPPTRITNPTRPPHAPSPILDSTFRLTPKSRYGECRKNQAASAGTTAYDGCGEFVSANSGEGSLDCAACGCHRSFHREESFSETILEALKISPSQFRQIFCSPYGDGKMTEEKKRVATEEAGRGKRLRRRFTAEQTEKMRSYAEKLGWKISSESKESVKEFCNGIGVTRKNLRVWMNNHNEVHGRHEEEEEEKEKGRVKRFKTKFTAEQTEKMRSYAEKLRWKVSTGNREEIERFCIEIGVHWNNFMTWMNNHKEEIDE